MKARITFLSMMAVAGLFMTSCDDDDDDKWKPDYQITSAFEQRYPNASRVEWEREAGNYYVADFRESNVDKEAWFTSDGTWVMTETDVRPADLPEVIRTALNATEYTEANGWRIDDVDKLERFEMETIYILDVEQRSTDIDMDLYFTEDGTFIKAISDESGNQGQYVPGSPSNEAKDFITEQYPNATITDYDSDLNGYEVDILHEGISKEVHFDAQYTWQYTSWDIWYRDLGNNGITETSVKTTIETLLNGDYSAYRVDDVDYRENSNGTDTYVVELERNGYQDVKIAIDLEGNYNVMTNNY